MRIRLAAAVIALLASSGHIAPAAAQECDPTVCANPLGFGARVHHRHHHHLHHRHKHAGRTQPPKPQSKYLRY